MGVWIGNESSELGRTDQIKRYESSGLTIGGAGLCPLTVRWNKRSIEFQTEAGLDGWGRRAGKGSTAWQEPLKTITSGRERGAPPHRAKDRNKTPFTKPPPALALA